jgi:hypothetical protein
VSEAVSVTAEDAIRAAALLRESTILMRGPEYDRMRTEVLDLADRLNPRSLRGDLIAIVATSDEDVTPGSTVDRIAYVMAEHVRRLPEHNATSSRDFGRGYAHAVREVLALLEDSTTRRTT